MQNKFIVIFTAAVAAIIVMIIHELPKSLIFMSRNRRSIKNVRSIFKMQYYIDPIGFIFFLTCYCGFSRPYMFGIKDKKTNFKLGVTGFLSLITSFLISTLLLKLIFVNSYVLLVNQIITDLVYCTLYFISLFSVTMFLINLFPVTTFDIALIIAGKYPSKYFTLVQKDLYIKAMLMFAIILGLIRSIGMMFVNAIL